MKTEIKIVLKDKNDDLLRNHQFTIEPYKTNRNITALPLIQDSTDNDGVFIAHLEPEWFPYRITYREAGGKVAKNFYVVESDKQVDWEILQVGNYNLDPLSPAGNVLRQAIEVLVEAHNMKKEAKEIRENLIGSIAQTAGQIYETRISALTASLTNLERMVETLATDKTHVLTKLLEHEGKHEEMVRMHGDMALMAAEYVAARDTGAINLGGHWMWFDKFGVLRWKEGPPTDQFDGTPVHS